MLKYKAQYADREKVQQALSIVDITAMVKAYVSTSKQFKLVCFV